MDDDDYTKCVCPNSGWCERFQRQMHGRSYDICQGLCLSKWKQERYRRHWADAPPNEKPKPRTPPKGTGTELTAILGGKIGSALLGKNAKCSRCILRAGYMDRMGTEWCSENISTIVDWLAESAAKKGFPFSNLLASRLVRYAIKRAKKKENE